MSLDFKYGFDDFFRDETFCDDFTYRNSPAALRRFPFPFDRDDYMYSVNMEPHVPGRKGSVFEKTLDVDEHYVAEMLDRAKVLAQDPLRCQSLPHMTLAGWDTLELVMEPVTEKSAFGELLETISRQQLVRRRLEMDSGRVSITFTRSPTLAPLSASCATIFLDRVDCLP